MQAHPQLVPGVRRIAVLRANGLGDLVFALPALAALRRAYPEAEIVLLGTELHRALLEGRPAPVDRVEAVPALAGLAPGRADPAATEAFLARMRAESFDLALQMHGGGRESNPLVARLGARVTAGFRSPDAAPLDLSLPYVYLQPEVLRYLELAALVGAAPAGLAPRLAVFDGDFEDADGLLPADGGPLVVVCPGATDPRRRWPAERFAAVAAALVGEGGPGARDRRRARRGLGAEVARGAGAGVSRRERAPQPPRARRGAGPGRGGGGQRLGAAAPRGRRRRAHGGDFWGPNVVSTLMERVRHRPLCVLDPRCPRCGEDLLRGACPHRDTLVASVTVAEVLASARDLLDLPVREPDALARALDPRARRPHPLSRGRRGPPPRPVA